MVNVLDLVADAVYDAKVLIVKDGERMPSDESIIAKIIRKTLRIPSKRFFAFPL